MTVAVWMVFQSSIKLAKIHGKSCCVVSASDLGKYCNMKPHSTEFILLPPAKLYFTNFTRNVCYTGIIRMYTDVICDYFTVSACL